MRLGDTKYHQIIFVITVVTMQPTLSSGMGAAPIPDDLKNIYIKLKSLSSSANEPSFPQKSPEEINQIIDCRYYL